MSIMQNTAASEADGFSAPVPAGDPRAEEMLRIAMGAGAGSPEGSPAKAQQALEQEAAEDAAKGRAFLASLGVPDADAEEIISNAGNPDFWTFGKIMPWRLCDGVLKAKARIGAGGSLASFWNGIAWKILVSESADLLDKVDAQGLAGFIARAGELGLDPLAGEIGAAFDYGSGRIEPVILMDGWRRLIFSRPDFSGLRYEESAEQEAVYLPARTGLLDEQGRDEFDWSANQAKLPRRVTCSIYIKGFDQPVEGAAYAKEDLFPAPWWAEHPLTSLRNVAFKRAARCLVKGSAGADAFSLQEKDELAIQNELSRKRAARARADGFQSFGLKSPQERGVPVFVDSKGNDIDVLRNSGAQAAQGSQAGMKKKEMA